MSFTLELFDIHEMPVVLKECYRVLAERGRIGVVAMAKRQNEPVAVKIYEWVYYNIPSLMDCRPIYVSDLLESAGFKLVHLLPLSGFGIPVDVVIAEKSLLDKNTQFGVV